MSVRAIILGLALVLFFFVPCSAREDMERIEVIVGKDCACGSHSGSFDALYERGTIEVSFHLNSTASKRTKHPVRLFEARSEIVDWSGWICPEPGQSRIGLSGNTVTIEGRWKDRRNFEAQNIFIRSDNRHFSRTDRSSRRKATANLKGKSYRLENFEILVLDDPGDRENFTVQLLSDGQKIYSGESRLSAPRAEIVEAIPSADCRSMLINLFSGGAHCCSTLLLSTVCDGSRTAVEIELADGPDAEFIDADRDGTSEIKVHDWAFNYYEASSSERLSHAASPAMARLLIFAGQTWRPDRPGEFRDFYRRQMAVEAGSDRPDEGDVESLAATAIKNSYLTFMMTGDEAEGLRVLRRQLPASWQSSANKMYSDIKKAAVSYNPVKPIR